MRACGWATGTAPAGVVSRRSARSSNSSRCDTYFDGDRAVEVVTELLVDLLRVPPGQEDPVQPATVCGEVLVVDAGDREHLPFEGDRAGHGKAGTHGTSRERRDERGDHGDAGGRPVVGRPAGVDVQVDVGAAREGRVEAAAPGVWSAAR